MPAPLPVNPPASPALLALCDWATGGPLPPEPCAVCGGWGCEFCPSAPAVQPEPEPVALVLAPAEPAPSDYVRLARLVRELAATRGMGWVLEVTGEALSDVYCQPRDAK